MLRYIISRYQRTLFSVGNVTTNARKQVTNDSFHTPLGRWAINDCDDKKMLKADLATHDSCGGIQCNYPIMPKDRIKPAEKRKQPTPEKILNDRLALYLGETAYKN
tara:strand:+ start:1045 stop:1362 length:318 start_codon:yes stop_codon:yes gene_type:complete